MPLAKPCFNLVLDFDGTITKADTTAVIGSAIIAHARSQAPPETSEDAMPRSMDFYSRQYFEDLQNWKSSFACPHAERKSIQDELEFLSTSRKVEQQSLLRVRRAVLETPGGISTLRCDEHARDAFMLEAGRSAVRRGHVEVREPEVLKELMRTAQSWAVVSVSWSRRFIMGVLMESELVEADAETALAAKIWCNEILGPVPTDDRGEPKLICTAKDKLEAMNAFLSQCAHPDDNEIYTFYAGDSMTDLGCLASDSTVGVYIGSSGPNDPVIARLRELNVNVLNVDGLRTRPSVLGGATSENAQAMAYVCCMQRFARLRDCLSSNSSD